MKKTKKRVYGISVKDICKALRIVNMNRGQAIRAYGQGLPLLEQSLSNALRVGWRRCPTEKAHKIFLQRLSDASGVKELVIWERIPDKAAPKTLATQQTKNTPKGGLKVRASKMNRDKVIALIKIAKGIPSEDRKFLRDILDELG